MPLSTNQLLDDRNRQFDDWAVLVTYREVVQTYDPESGQVAETSTDHQLSALVGPIFRRPSPGTAANHLSGEQQLVVKAESLPAPVPRLIDRIVLNGAEHDLLSYTHNATTQTFTLHIRPRS